ALGVERADRLAALDRRLAEIAAREAQLATVRSERDALAATVAALEAERADRPGETGRRSEEISTLPSGAPEPAAARPVAANDAGDNMRKAIEAIEAEKSTLEARLAGIETDLAATLAENAELKRLAANANDGAG